ncbi:MAG: hypothetical protein HEQ38_17165 [Gemmatimonas sp.]|nr:hypothetical protein [Gemmatimonas sp.]
MKTARDFAVASKVWISFTDLGVVTGHVKLDEYPDELVAVHLTERNETASGMVYHAVLVHPSNITHEVRNTMPALKGWYGNP